MLARWRGIACARRRTLAEPGAERRSMPSEDEVLAPMAGQFGARPSCAESEALIGGSEGDGFRMLASPVPSPSPALPSAPVMLLRRLRVCV